MAGLNQNFAWKRVEYFRVLKISNLTNLQILSTEKNGSLFLIFVKKQSQELTRVNPDRNIFSINVELTSTFFLLYRGLVHHHH